MDDDLIVGHPEAIDDTIEQAKKNGFVAKVKDDLRDYFPVKFNSFLIQQRHG